MKTGRLVQSLVVSLATLGMCFPEMVLAAAPPATPNVVDIALADGGVLHGQVIDLQGGKASGVPVAVKAPNQAIVNATTTNDGHFTVPGLRGGVYQVAAGQGQGVYRLWTANAAPPSAQKNAIVFTQNATAPRGTMKMLLTNPIVIAGVVATAIAVPVALANSHPSSP